MGLKINFNKTKAVYFNENQLPEPLKHKTTILNGLRATSSYLGILLDKLNLEQHTLHYRQSPSPPPSHALHNGDRGRRRLPSTKNLQLTGNHKHLRLRSSSPSHRSAIPTRTGREVAKRSSSHHVGASRWTKLCNMRAEAKIPQLTHRIHAMNICLLGKKVANPCHSNIIRSVKQSLAHDETLFRKTWASKAAQSKSLQVVDSFTKIISDNPHPTYSHDPPWEEFRIRFVTLLSGKKSNLAATNLARQAQHALAAGNSESANVYYTDGSMGSSTHRAATAFTHKEETRHFRLPDKSSTLQTEQVAIHKALEHAKPRHRHVTIHADSLGAIQCLKQEHTGDNIHLVT